MIHGLYEKGTATMPYDEFTYSERLDYPDYGDQIAFYACTNGYGEQREYEYEYDLVLKSSDIYGDGDEWIVLDKGTIDTDEYNIANDSTEIERFMDDHRPNIPDDAANEYRSDELLCEVCVDATDDDSLAALLIDYDKSIYESEFDEIYKYARDHHWSPASPDTDRIRDTLIRMYDDLLCNEIDPGITFKDVHDLLVAGRGKDLYSLIGVGDSIVREYVFQQMCLRPYLFDDDETQPDLLADGTVDYDFIYYMWLR